MVYKEDFLDSTDRAIYLLAQKLYLADQPVEKARLATSLQISGSTLNRYLKRLAALLNPALKKQQVQIINQELVARLLFNGQATLDQILLNALVRDSVSYQIMMCFYDHGDQTMIHLGASLNLSESSLYRHLRRLNQLLAEFEIQIHNGQLTGTELQIRYFYYRLFRLIQVPPTDDYPAIGFLIQRLQLELNFTFTNTSVKRVRLWLEVAHQRSLTANGQDQSIPPQVQELYQHNELYEMVAKCYRHVFAVNRQKRSHFEVESLCVMLIGMSVFNRTTNVVTRFSAIYRANHTTLAKIVREFETTFFHVLGIDQTQWSFEMTKSVFDLCARMFCFHGNLDALNSNYTQYYRDHYFSKQSQVVVTQVIEDLQHTSRPKLNQLVKTKVEFLTLRLHLIVREFRYQELNEVTIGLDTTFDIEVEHLISDQIKYQFQGELQINVSGYQPGNSYDLIVTNYRHNPYDDAKFSYQITSYGTQHDFSNIHELIVDKYTKVRM